MTATDLFLLPPCQIRLVNRVSRDIVVETELAVKVNRHQNISVFLAVKQPYSTEGYTDRPSQEGREDVPSELSFLVSASEADPTPVCDAFEQGDSPGTDLIHGH